jgi:hypothetical protein
MSVQNTPSRIKLPEINKSRLDKSQSSSRYNDSRNLKSQRNQLYDIKPTFIAKKVGDDDLFGATIKGNHSGLSKIHEEEGPDGDYIPSPRFEEDEIKESPTQNIFQMEMLASSKYKEHNKGPIYRNGQLIKHSIVGSAEMFERYQKQLKRVKDHKDSTVSFEKDNLSVSDVSAINRGVRQTATINFDSGSSSFLGGMSNSLQAVISKKQQQGDKKKELKRDIIITKEELLKEIEKMKEREEDFYRDQNHKYAYLPWGDQLHHTKDARCLEKFEEQRRDWENTIHSIAKKAGREPQTSVAFREEEYRQKREMADAFDAIRTDFEKYGPTYWFMSLRNTGELPKGAISFHDFPEAFNNTFHERRNSSVEIIRKPNSFTNSRFDMSSSLSRSIGRTEREYLEQKMLKHEKYLKKVRPLIGEEFRDLMVYF